MVAQVTTPLDLREAPALPCFAPEVACCQRLKTPPPTDPSHPAKSTAHPPRKTALDNTLLWLASTALIVLGLAGTVLPVLPGTVLVWGGIVLGAWIDDFTRVSAATVVVVSVLAVLAWGLDHAAGLLGARHAGASRQALLGAAVGTVAGLFMGLVGVLFMPLVGAAVGEYLARQDHAQALKVGVATWVGIMVGLIAKVVLACVMVGIFGLALLV